MGNTPTPQFGERLIQLVLRGRTDEPLIRSDDDVEALGSIATRMIFWCGGAIYAWRSEGNEMRFALQIKHAPLSSVAPRISGAYANHLRQTRKLTGSMFKHYAVVPLEDDVYLDDLVMWLHRPAERSRLWTAEAAYLTPRTLFWIDTPRILNALSTGSPVTATYLRRKSEPILPAALKEFMRRPILPLRDSHLAKPPNMELIARLAAEHSGVAYNDMLAHTRKRPVSKARAIATVLLTRKGASAADVSRLFNRSRSTLIEQVEHYRVDEPDIFTAAEQWLDAKLAELDAEASE